jgi:hypothetical protein
MKDVFVSHSKEDKGIAKKLVSKLETSGISCYVRQRDIKSGNEQELIADSNIFVLVLSSHSQESEEQIKQMKYAVEEGCLIVPFRSGKTDHSLSTQYLLHSLEWVDPFEDGFDEAFDILLEIIEENSEGKPKPVKKRKVDQTNNFQLQRSHLAVIIALFALVIIYLVFFNDKDESSNLTNSNGTEQIDPPDYVNAELKTDEQIVVGSWKMVDYEDSRTMTPAELAETMRNVEELKKVVLLTFNADRSFIRAGFTPQAQRGYWEYDSEKNKIYLTPENVNQREEINILNLSETDMTFIVTEVIQTPEGLTETVTTKLGFKKQ